MAIGDLAFGLSSFILVPRSDLDCILDDVCLLVFV